jgi:hypothetical protein
MNRFARAGLVIAGSLLVPLFDAGVVSWEGVAR